MAVLDDVVETIQAHALALPGMRGAPIDVPEQIPVFPYSICYPGRGRAGKESEDWYNGEHTIYVEFHGSRSDLGRTLATLRPYVTLFIAALWDDETLGSKVDTIQEIRYNIRSFVPDGLNTVGYRFEIDVLIEPNL